MDKLITDHLEPLVDLIVTLGSEAKRSMGCGLASAKIKSDGTSVTKIDLHLERTIRAFLEERIPGHGILGEEEGLSGPQQSQYTWVIDPLDGTTNYVLGLPVWGISVALLKKGIPLWGCVYVPVLDQLYLASRRGGAIQNGYRIHAAQRQHLNPEDCVGITSDGAKRYEYLFPQKIRSMGSAAAQAAFVGCGYYVGYFIDEWYIWDIAAGLLIAKEAGVRVTDAEGRAFDRFPEVGPQKGPPLLFASPGIHSKLLPLIVPKSTGHAAG